MKRAGWDRVVIAASGPSFTPAQAELIERTRRRGDWRVIAVSDAWAMLPSADVLYACDGPWWTVVKNGARRIQHIRASFDGELWTQQKLMAEQLGLRHILGSNDEGLTTRPDAINNGKNSGYQAMNLAYLFGAKRIVAVGLDMQKGANGEQHFFGDHPYPLDNRIDFDDCKRRFVRLAKDLEEAGVDVINASARTALKCFRRVSLEVALSC